MNPKDLADNYNKIANWWTTQMEGSNYGMEYVNKAISYTSKIGSALDIGCGSNCRMIEAVIKNNFNIIGLDISSEMIKLAKSKYPKINFINANFLDWSATNKYDLIIAWDSIFHIPKQLQREVIQKMSSLLNSKGVLLFTAGSNEGETSGYMNKILFEYASIGYIEIIKILENDQCRTILMEEDQFPSGHMVFICKKITIQHA